jgi:hypothetical protein
MEEQSQRYFLDATWCQSRMTLNLMPAPFQAEGCRFGSEKIANESRVTFDLETDGHTLPPATCSRGS